jgi:hypothetical protein
MMGEGAPGADRSVRHLVTANGKERIDRARRDGYLDLTGCHRHGAARDAWYCYCTAQERPFLVVTGGRRRRRITTDLIDLPFHDTEPFFSGMRAIIDRYAVRGDWFITTGMAWVTVSPDDVAAAAAAIAAQVALQQDRYRVEDARRAGL